MKKKTTVHFVYICYLMLFFIVGCPGGGSDHSPVKKAQVSMAESGTTNIYDILEDYPALEAFFTNGDLEIAVFEEKLFGEFLGNDSTADVLVNLVDLFPLFIDKGTNISAHIFSEEVQTEMMGKGPIPDFMSAIGALTRNILSVEGDQMAPFYEYLDKLDIKENRTLGGNESMDYILDIIVKLIKEISNFDKDAINLFMALSIKDYVECKIPAEGNLDFADFDMLLEKFTIKSPEGISKILQGLKSIFYDEDVIKAYGEFMHAIGRFMGDDKSYTELKALLVNLYKKYTEDELGEIIDGLWDNGPSIGPNIEEIGIEGYGKNGKAQKSLREFLVMEPFVMNTILETLHEFEKEGYGMDKLDDQFILMKNTDPFCFDLKGEGEFGNGNFYEPTAELSYKEFSCIKGFVGLSRWNTPLTLTANILYEDEYAEASKKYMRVMVPRADEITGTALLWTEQYKKGEGYFLGHGQPVTEKTGYGKMVNGVYVAPACPAVLIGASVALHQIAEALIHGPYDNIYDNLKWFGCERKYYLVIDLVQVAPEIPGLKAVLMPFFNLFGIKTLPVTAIACNGITPIMYAELGMVVDKLPEAMTNELVKVGMPDWVIKYASEQLKKYLPVGYPVEGTDRIYFLPQDLRDFWTMCLALGYYDSSAFHPDRYLDRDNPENYMWNYDIRDYTYAKNKDTANPILHFLGVLTVAVYKSYMEVVDVFPRSMDAVEERQNAARKAFSGLIYPFDHLLNGLTAFAERTTEASIYEVPGNKNMPLVGLLEPLIGMESHGVLDSLFRFLSITGKPDLFEARMKIITGLGEIIRTIEKDSPSTYTLAKEILECANKASDDIRRWDTMKMMMETFEGILSKESSNQIVDDLLGLVKHLTSVDVSDEELALATRAIVDIYEKSTGEKVFTRMAMHLVTILDAVDTTHIWGDALSVMDEALSPEGILNYVLCGMDRDTDYSWDEIFRDTDRFFHSELMLKYEEGTFWKDIYYLLDFMADALE